MQFIWFTGFQITYLYLCRECFDTYIVTEPKLLLLGSFITRLNKYGLIVVPTTIMFTSSFLSFPSPPTPLYFPSLFSSFINTLYDICRNPCLCFSCWGDNLIELFSIFHHTWVWWNACSDEHVLMYFVLWGFIINWLVYAGCQPITLLFLFPGLRSAMWARSLIVIYFFFFCWAVQFIVIKFWSNYKRAVKLSKLCWKNIV